MPPPTPDTGEEPPELASAPIRRSPADPTRGSLEEDPGGGSSPGPGQPLPPPAASFCLVGGCSPSPHPDPRGGGEGWRRRRPRVRFPPPRSASDRSPPPPGAPCFRPRLGLGAVAQVRPPARSPSRSHPPAAAPPPRRPFPHRAGGSSQVAREALGWGSPAGDPGPGHRAQERTLRRVRERGGGGARGTPGWVGGRRASSGELRPRLGAAPVWVGQTPPSPSGSCRGAAAGRIPAVGGTPGRERGVSAAVPLVRAPLASGGPRGKGDRLFSPPPPFIRWGGRADRSSPPSARVGGGFAIGGGWAP